MGSKRRIDVMLSSTFWDLEDKRDEVLRLMGRHDLHDIAMENDAALSTMDKIDSSLSKVDRASAYVCIIGYRYGTREVCARRNADNLSLTELEFRRAQERDIPRCTLIMSGRYRGIPLSDFEAVSAEDKTSLTEFRKLAESDRVYASFDDDADFTVKAMQSLEQLRDDLDARERAKTAAAASSTVSFERPPSPDDNLPTIPPAFHYVRKPYIERQGFAGRAKELALIDRWATSPDAMLLFQAIGGMGKSMLTWHWLKTRAAIVRDDWAGQLWYSFYEQGADLNDFCVQALAYIRHQPPRFFRGRRTLDLGDELRRELDLRPWLLILDGLERVLVAYNRAGKEHMTDEEAVVARDGMGLDREPRSCFRPEDDDILAMLAQVGRGKLLASSRLTPSALTNAARQPIPGVRSVALEGLAPEDAEVVLRKAGVRGDGWRIQQFLADKFDCHPLSVGAVAGQVMTFLGARGDFDRWVEHPRGGRDPALITKDLRGRQNHILSRAFDDLDDEAKALLGSIALASIELTPDILRILNPKRPIEPAKPDSLKHAEIARREDFPRLERERGDFAIAYTAWQQQADAADARLEQILPDLEARGLLQHDPETDSFDMHPAIRHTALMGLSAEVRGATGTHVSDALSSRPYMPCNDARTLGELALVTSRVKALNTAGKIPQAGQILIGSDLAMALFRLEYHHEQLELLQPGFPGGWARGPIAFADGNQPELMTFALISLRGSGQRQAALKLQEALVQANAESDAHIVSLGTFALDLLAENLPAHAFRLIALAGRIAQAEDEKAGMEWVDANHAWMLLTAGRLDEAEVLLAALRDAPEEDPRKSIIEAPILASRLGLLFRTGRLNKSVADELLKRARLLGQRSQERLCLLTIATWHQDNGDQGAALDVLADLIVLANEVGAHDLPEYEGRRGFLLTKLNRMEEARRIAEKIDRGKNRPHIALARLYLELGKKTEARDHGLAGYKQAWGDGPPYCNHWGLEDCRKVLAAIGEPEPALPPFDPAKVEPFAFEPDVERLINRIISEKAEHAGAKTRRNIVRLAVPSATTPNEL